MNRGRLLSALPLAALLLLALGASVTQAGTYTVYSCHTPGGRAVSVDGWRAQNTIGAATSITSSNDCNLPDGALHAHLTGGGFSHWRVNDSAAWVFRPPSGTTISGFRARSAATPRHTSTRSSSHGLTNGFPHRRACKRYTASAAERWAAPRGRAISPRPTS